MKPLPFKTRWLPRLAALCVSLGLLAPASLTAAPILNSRIRPHPHTPTLPHFHSATRLTKHALLFVTDGGRPDYFRQFAATGLLPAYARLEAEGAMGANGMLPQLPTSTRVGWQTLSTGAWAGTHGALNNVYARHGEPMGQSYQPGIYAPLEAETLPEAAERAGLKVLLYDWNSSDQPAIQGPWVKYWRTFTRAGVAQNYDEPAVAQGAAAWGLMFDRLTLTPVSGGAGGPRSFSPLLGTRLRLEDFGGLAYEYAVRLYDSTNDGRTNYDRAAVLSGATTLADLAVGQWAEVRLTLAGGQEEGKAAGFYLKLLQLDPNPLAGRVKFFVSAISRVTASPPALEDYLAEHFPTRAGVGGALVWERLIDEATYAEGAALSVPFNTQALPYLLGEYAPDTNLALVGYLNTDIIQHATLALLTEGSPVYDDANRDGRPDGRLEEWQAYLEDTYQGADRTLAAAWNAMPADTVVVAASDHGFAPTWKAVYAPRVLADAGLQPDPQTSNCVASERALAKACWVGGTAMIYLNVQGREPNGVIAPADYEPVRQQVIDAWLALEDGGKTVVHSVFTQEQARFLPNGWSTASMAHPDKTGDVIVFLKPPYQFDFAEGGAGPIRDTTVWWAAHGHPPQAGEGLANTNLYATFYLAGPGIRHAVPAHVRAVDVAPTLAYLLGIPAPAQSQGRVLRELITTSTCLPAQRWRLTSCLGPWGR